MLWSINSFFLAIFFFNSPVDTIISFINVVCFFFEDLWISIFLFELSIVIFCLSSLSLFSSNCIIGWLLFISLFFWFFFPSLFSLLIKLFFDFSYIFNVFSVIDPLLSLALKTIFSPFCVGTIFLFCKL